MLILIVALAGLAGWRLTCLALGLLRGLPRSNDDLVFV